MQTSHPPHPKPLLRGWLHCLAAFAAAGMTVGFVVKTADERRLWLSLLIFGMSMTLLYAVSAIYHIVDWRGRAWEIWRSFDHANIFVLIAGTYTPFCVVLLSGWFRPLMLGLIWGLAAVGVALKIWRPFMRRGLSVGFYMGMGWLGVALLPHLIRVLPTPALGTLGAGALLYTLGGICYSLRRPNPLPRIIGFHEVFHLLGVSANSLFILTLWLWVIPFGRGA